MQAVAVGDRLVKRAGETELDVGARRRPLTLSADARGMRPAMLVLVVAAALGVALPRMCSV